MVKVDTLCTCIRLAPVGLLIAVHCSSGHWPTDAEARDRALRYGFSIALFPERPLSLLTHMLVHLSAEHLLSNLFSLTATLMEFGGDDTMRESVEEDDLPLVARRTLGSFAVMLLGGVVGGIGGQVMYNDGKVASRLEQANRIAAERQRLTRSPASASSLALPGERPRHIVGEPRAGMSGVRKPNMPRLWTDEGSVVTRNIIENASRQRSRYRQRGESVGNGGGHGNAPSTTAATLPAAVAARAAAPPPSPAEAYIAALRVRVIYKMRGSVDADEADGDGGDDGYGEDTTVGESSGGLTSLPPAGVFAVGESDDGGGGGAYGLIARTFANARLSVQHWSATKAAEAQALLNRSMLMCGASAGVCALSGFNLTYYRRPATALCLAVPEILVLAHGVYLARWAPSTTSGGAGGLISTWRTLMPGQTVGHAAHVGGFLVGCAMGLVWRRVAPRCPEQARRRRQERRRRERAAEERASAEKWYARPSPMNSNSSST